MVWADDTQNQADQNCKGKNGGQGKAPSQQGKNDDSNQDSSGWEAPNHKETAQSNTVPGAWPNSSRNDTHKPVGGPSNWEAANTFSKPSLLKVADPLSQPPQIPEDAAGHGPPPVIQPSTRPISPFSGPTNTNYINSLPTEKAKHYWSSWKIPSRPQRQDGEANGPPELNPSSGEDPLYAIPREIAQRSNLTHQVQGGRPRAYMHKMATPQYMDSHENPYAVFVFKYRSKGMSSRPSGVLL
jgi:hypothetical protein